MNTKILGLLAVGLLAGPMVAKALPITVGSEQWEISICVGTWLDCNNGLALQAMPWWTGIGNDSVVAKQFAEAWGAAYPTQGSPWFTYDREGSTLGYVFAWVWDDQAGALDVAGPDGTVDPYKGRTTPFAVARRITNVPEPGSMALLGLGLVGLGFSRRRKAA